MSVDVIHADCSEAIKQIADASIDACVTDPPYALTSTVKRWANTPRTESTMPKVPVYARATAGFMGQKWDTGDTAFSVDFWREVLRVLKPGAHLLAFSGTRTYHRLACAIEDAGFDIRDQIGWLYGSGFPKSHNAGNGWGTALKPAWEPIVLARKPLIGTVAANVLEHGTGAINVDGCRIEGRERNDYGLTNATRRRGSTYGEPSASADFDATKGRWPANVIHDGSEEVVAAFPDSASCNSPSSARVEGTILGGSRTQGAIYPGEHGSAARFFYSAKADAADRLGSKHPTVKPVDLMAYLIRLVTPKGGLVLDPFAGSGTTGMAAMREGMRAVLIEREADYVADINRRIAHVSGEDAPLFASGAEVPT